jgi:phage-related minor tail protein
MSDKDYSDLISKLRISKKEYEAEQEKIRKENERLKAEREAKEKQMVEERTKAEEKLKAEREAKEKLEAEIRAKKEAEQQAEKERIESDKKAQSAPDKEKLLHFAESIDNLIVFDLKTEQAAQILNEAKILLSKTSNYIREKIKTL